MHAPHQKNLSPGGFSHCLSAPFRDPTGKQTLSGLNKLDKIGLKLPTKCPLRGPVREQMQKKKQRDSEQETKIKK